MARFCRTILSPLETSVGLARREGRGFDADSAMMRARRSDAGITGVDDDGGDEGDDDVAPLVVLRKVYGFRIASRAACVEAEGAR